MNEKNIPYVVHGAPKGLVTLRQVFSIIIVLYVAFRDRRQGYCLGTRPIMVRALNLRAISITRVRVQVMGAIHKMAPAGVCGALLHTGPYWMYGWLREAEKTSPSESYFSLILLEYAQGDTYRRSLCSKNLKNQARERVRARFFFGSMTVSSVGLRTTYNTAEWLVQ